MADASRQMPEYQALNDHCRAYPARLLEEHRDHLRTRLEEAKALMSMTDDKAERRKHYQTIHDCRVLDDAVLAAIVYLGVKPEHGALPMERVA